MITSNFAVRTLTLTVLAALTACAIPRDVPPSAEGLSAPLAAYGDLQSRLNKLNTASRLSTPAATDAALQTVAKYQWASAQCWVRHAYSERHENDAAGFAAAALSEADKLIKGLEGGNAGSTGTTGTLADATPLINHTAPVRPDLWQRAQALKKHPGFACAAATTGCLEVQLSRAGHELSETGWRHANPYVAIAEDMAAQAEQQAAGCAVTKRVATVLPDPAPPTTPPTPPTPPPPARTVEKKVLNASALFAFDRRGAADMLPAGKAELDALALRLKDVYATVDTIEVTGYTDRLGSVAYNRKLSEDRAATVKAYLQAKGVTAPITAAGRGPAAPLVQCPGSRPTPQLTACLQPNRRVEIAVTGVKR
jgi:OmpA-OmpF porin, OOP family